MTRQRRGKRDKQVVSTEQTTTTTVNPNKERRRSRSFQKHASDKPSGGMESLLPSFIGLVILVCGVMAKMGFRGRATVAGIDLGTTNSVICVQAPAKGVGKIDCIADPATGSPIVPSVVSFLDYTERRVGPSSKIKSLLDPHPSHVVVGAAAKRRIDSHPHHTLYNAKRVLGRPSSDPAVTQLQSEVEFDILTTTEEDDDVLFKVADSSRPIPPQQVGAYVVHHLSQITQQFLGHDNVKAAVICVPAKFNPKQRQKTYEAFQQAGITVARLVEEPTAAALAYGLHRKEGVDYILVYDFGGGTLDVSLLHVSDGFVDVMGSDGDDRLGGTDFDIAVAHFLLEQRGGAEVVDRVTKALHQLEKSGTVEQHQQHGSDLEEILSATCPVLKETPLCTVSSFHTVGEQLKIGLSDYPDQEASVTSECLGLKADYADASASLEDFCSSLEPVQLTLTSAEYNRCAQPLFDRSIVPIQRLLNDLDLQVEDIDEVVMVGGTTRMPQIRKLVQEAMSVEQLNTHIDPDITVAYGAASVID